MNCFADLKLKCRLFISVALMAMSMIVMCVLGYFLSSRAYENLNRVYEDANLKTISSVALSEDYSKNMVTLVHKLALGTYPWNLGLARLLEIKEDIHENLKKLHQLPLNMDEAVLLQEIEGKTTIADNLLFKLESVIQHHDIEELQKINQRLYPNVEPVSYRAQLFLNYELGRSRQLAKENKVAFKSSYYGWMGLLCLICILGIFLMIARNLERTVSFPLNQLLKGMQEIANGEGDLTKRLQVQSRDEIGQVEEAFNTFIGKLQNVSQMKLDLISVVSHQLKTPVAEITGYVENLLEGLAGELTPKQRQYLEEMREIGWDNYRLICDLLSVSKIERGVVTVNLKAISLRDVVELSTRDYEKLACRKGLNFSIEGPLEEIWIYADQDKMVETLRNVINNVIKCTDQGSVTVSWGSENGTSHIEVRDTGIGMKPEVLDRIFTKGRVLGQEAHRSGAGLGLFISKYFMKIQNGDIKVISEPGKGSCFTLIIPEFRKNTLNVENREALLV